MTRRDKKLVKAAQDADRATVDVRIKLHQIHALACECGDLEAAGRVSAVIDVLRSVAFYAIKKQRVEVDESK